MENSRSAAFACLAPSSDDLAGREMVPNDVRFRVDDKLVEHIGHMSGLIIETIVLQKA